MTATIQVQPALTDNSMKILKDRYFEPGESVDQMFRRVSGQEETFERIMRQLDFLPNSPTLMNAGTAHEGRSTFSACFKFDVSDSMLEGEDCIIETGRKAAAVAKWGGGVGYYLGDLRARNSPIQSVHRVACGPVNVLWYYNVIGTTLITQGGRRELAQMAILPWNHPDVREFIHVKDQDPQALRTFNISVSVTDDFMKKVASGQPGSELTLWNEIVDSAWKTGDPGLFFVDAAERGNPTPHLGKLTGTNPCGEVPLLNNEACLDGSTLIDTDEGLVSIGSLLMKKSFSVYTHNQMRVDDCRAIYKGARKTIQVQLNTGQTLRCTPDHKILTDRGWMEVNQLQVGSRIRVANHPTVAAGRQEHLTDEMLGWFLGDGWLTNEKSCGILFSKADEEAMTRLMPEWDRFVEKDYALQVQPTGVKQKSCEKRTTISKFTELGFPVGNSSKKRLPDYIFTADSSRQIAFLRGLFSADGGVKKSGQGKRNIINLSSSSKRLLKEVQLLLLRFGIQSHLVWTKFKVQKRNDQGNLRIAGKSALAFLDKIGFNLKEKTEAFEYGERPNNNHNYFRVVKIEDAGETEVYDIGMPEQHHFIANGMVVHNCNLGSLNLGNFVTVNREIDYNRLEEVTRTATKFLDQILDRNSFPHPAITAAVARTRKLGLGVMGWADMLALMGVHYDSEKAVAIGYKVMEFINDVARDQSARLGAFKSPYEANQRDNCRNATRTCIAPTGTISILANASSGIEPHYALEWERTLNKGVADKEEVIKERIPVWDRLDGFVPKVANDIPYHWHVKHQAAFQAHTDLACSKTINLPNSASREDIAKAYIQMWQDGCKGGTIFRDGCRSTGEQVLKSTDSSKKTFVMSDGNGKPREELLHAMTNGEHKIGCRRKPPKERQSITHHITIGEFDGYIHAGMYEDGSLCEIFFTSGKEGSTVSGLLDSWAIAVSHGIQHGVALDKLVKKYSGMRFEPAGATGNKEIPICTSIVDYAVRWLDKRFGLGREDPNHKGEEIVSGMICPDCHAPAIYQGGCLTCKQQCGWSRCG